MLASDALGRLALGELSVSTASSIAAGSGAFSITGQDVNFQVAATLDVGVFVVISQDVAATVSLPAETGAFTLSGQAAGLGAAYSIRCEPYTAPNRSQWGFSALGEVALGQLATTSGGSITFQISGQDIALVPGMRAETGAFTITGNGISLVEGNVITAETGAYVLTWPNVATSISMPLGAGSFVITGATATELARASIKIRRFPRVGSTTATARTRGAGVKVRAYGG